jgi:hypothetical protein
MVTPPLGIWESEHVFYFNTPSRVTPISLSENLLGLDGILRHSADVLGTLLGDKVRDVEIVLNSVELNSYKDSFLFRCFFGKGDDAEKKLDEFRKTYHLKDVTPKQLAGFAIGAATLYGVWQYVKPAENAATEVNIHIENSFNNMGEEVGLSKDQVISVLDSALKGKKEALKKDVVKLIRPDGQEAGGKITFDDNDSFVIPDELVDIVPREFVKPDPTETVKNFEDKDIALRALDLDRPSKGWWAIAPDIADKRISVVLDQDLDPAKVPVGKMGKGDFSVVYRKDRKGQFIPKQIVLRRIRR